MLFFDTYTVVGFLTHRICLYMYIETNSTLVEFGISLH
jgi:hypothetical protein